MIKKQKLTPSDTVEWTVCPHCKTKLWGKTTFETTIQWVTNKGKKSTSTWRHKT